MNKETTGSPDRHPYHHGDLRAALLAAAELELDEAGIEGFSLRAVAKRAGVSHAAPAHHFTDANGLLTALAVRGFRRFVETQHRAMAQAPAEPRAQLSASGLGYVQFAIENPALFRLIFSSNRPDFADPHLNSAAFDGYDLLVRLVRQSTGTDARQSREGQRNVEAAWAMAHGLADLLIAGRLKGLAALPAAQRDAAICNIIDRSITPG